MWKGIVFPTIVMAVTWLLVSCSTTYYIYWLDRSYQRVFTENVAAIHAAGLVQETAWHMLALIRSPEDKSQSKKDRLPDLLRILEREVQTLRRLSITERERILADRLDGYLSDYKQSFGKYTNYPAVLGAVGLSPDVGNLAHTTDQIVDTAQLFRTVNQQLLDDAANQRESTMGSVLAARTTVQFAGQVLGVAYGWWIARRLQRSVARITVTLRDVSNMETAVGAVNVDPRQDLEGLHAQVEQVVARMQEANTELQKARMEVLRSERLAAVGELAAGVAHELRNPLTSVKLLLQYVAQKGSSEPLTNNRLQLILEEIARMESTIQGLLDFSRPPELNRSQHDLRGTLQRAINLVLGRAQQQNVKVSTALGNVPLYIQGDAAQLHQVFINLLINGLEAMPSGGTLTVEMTRQADEGSVCVQIGDTGDGIAEAIQKRLFEPFATTKDRGTGLGLAVSRRIIDQHRGIIRAENGPQGGAVFQVILPAAAPDPVTEVADAPA